MSPGIAKINAIKYLSNLSDLRAFTFYYQRHLKVPELDLMILHKNKIVIVPLNRN